MNAFDVRIYTIRRRKGRRRPFEVRWQAAGRTRSKLFLTRGLADSYRADLVCAAHQGLEFDPATGEPVLWAVPVLPVTTWLEHAVAYAEMKEMKWPHLAPHSRASLADALATVSPALTLTSTNLKAGLSSGFGRAPHGPRDSTPKPTAQCPSPPPLRSSTTYRAAKGPTSLTAGPAGRRSRTHPDHRQFLADLPPDLPELTRSTAPS